MSPISFGRIVWAVFPEARGEGKIRPMVVLSRPAESIKMGRVFVVACSTDVPDPLGPNEVALPFGLRGRAGTGLRVPTVAVCDWSTWLPLSSIETMGGVVSGQTLREICELAGATYRPER